MYIFLSLHFWLLHSLVSDLLSFGFNWGFGLSGWVFPLSTIQSVLLLEAVFQPPSGHVCLVVAYIPSLCLVGCVPSLECAGSHCGLHFQRLFSGLLQWRFFLFLQTSTSHVLCSWTVVLVPLLRAVRVVRSFSLFLPCLFRLLFCLGCSGL